MGYCYIKQFESFLCIGATGHQKMHLIFHQLSTHAVVDSSDSNADLQVEVSVSGICLSRSPTNDS